MGRPTRTGRTVHAARLLALCAVLVGMLAMHGLASSHHAPAAAAQHPAAAAAPHDATSAQPDDATSAQPPDHAAVLASTGPPGTGAVAAPAGTTCDDYCPGAVLALCLAVLAAAAALLGAAVLVHRRRRTAVTHTDPVRSVPASARVALRPADPVRELCISRT